MNPNPFFYFQLKRVAGAAYIPPFICVWFMVQLWREGNLYGVQLGVFLVWFVMALAAEYASHSIVGWLAGFFGLIALAIVLVLKRQWDNPD